MLPRDRYITAGATQDEYAALQSAHERLPVASQLAIEAELATMSHAAIGERIRSSTIETAETPEIIESLSALLDDVAAEPKAKPKRDRAHAARKRQVQALLDA